MTDYTRIADKLPPEGEFVRINEIPPPPGEFVEAHIWDNFHSEEPERAKLVGDIWVVERHGTYVYTDSDPDDEWRPYVQEGQ